MNSGNYQYVPARAFKKPHSYALILIVNFISQPLKYGNLHEKIKPDVNNHEK